VLLLDVSTLLVVSHTWSYLDCSSLCCSWTCLHYRGLCCTRTYLCTLGPELHLDVSNIQGPVLINYLFALLSRLTQFALLSLFLGTNRFVLLRFIHSLIITFFATLLYLKFLKVTGSLQFEKNFLTIKSVGFASKIIFLLTNMFVFASL
jgi:hypothetical protein